MKVLPKTSMDFAQQERASEEIAELYQQAQHVAMLRIPYDLPSGQTFSPFIKNRFGNLTKHLIASKRWIAIVVGYLVAFNSILVCFDVQRGKPSAVLTLAVGISAIYFAHLSYFLATLAEFVPAYGLGTLKAIKAPSMICLAPLSIKFLWRQGFSIFRARIHGIERTVGWEEIIAVDRQDGADSLPLIVITARLMRRDEIFPVHLSGLANQADRLAFLRALDIHVPLDKRTIGFTDLLSTPNLCQLLLSAPYGTLEAADPVAELFVTKKESFRNISSNY